MEKGREKKRERKENSRHTNPSLLPAPLNKTLSIEHC